MRFYDQPHRFYCALICPPGQCNKIDMRNASVVVEELAVGRHQAINPALPECLLPNTVIFGCPTPKEGSSDGPQQNLATLAA